MRRIVLGLLPLVFLAGCGSDPASADRLTCDALAQQAVEYSSDRDVQLLKVRAVETSVDNLTRATHEVSKLSGAETFLALECTGVGVWSSGDEAPVRLTYTIDADSDPWVAWEPIYE